MLVLVLTYMHRQTLASGEQLARSFAHVIEEQTSRTVQATDQGLHLAVDGLAQLAASGTLTPVSGTQVLTDQVKQLPFLRAIWVIDTQGRIVFDSASGNIGVDLSDRDFFLKYRSHPDTGFFVGAPVVSRMSGTWQISVSRPWRAASGALQCIVVAALEPRCFDQLCRSADLGQGSSVALLRRNGLLMMRSPLVEASIGKSFSDNRYVRQAARVSKVDRLGNGTVNTAFGEKPAQWQREFVTVQLFKTVQPKKGNLNLAAQTIVQGHQRQRDFVVGVQVDHGQ